MHHNQWSYAQEQRHMRMPPPQSYEQKRNVRILSPPGSHLRYANPHIKYQNQVFKDSHNIYGRNNYPGPHWHHNHERQRSFASSQNETGIKFNEPSRGYNPSRFRYVSDSYLRSLKENDPCLQLNQPRNVQVAVIKPIARVDNSQEKIDSSCELNSDACKNNDKEGACSEDVTISKILDYKVLSSDMYSTNETEGQNVIDINSNCIEIKRNVSEIKPNSIEVNPNVSALISKSNSITSNINTNVLSLIKMEPSSEDYKETAKATSIVCDESKITSLPPIISNLFAKPSLGKYSTETECNSKQMNEDNTFNVGNNISDLSLIANSNFDNLTDQYKEKTIERDERQNFIECDITVNENEENPNPKPKLDPNFPTVSETHTPQTFYSPVKCSSIIEPSQENETKSIHNTDVSEYLLEVKPLTQSKHFDFQRISDNGRSEIPIQKFEKSTSNENTPKINPDDLTPEMLRERLFRKFINSSELMPVENKKQDQNFIMDHEKEFKSLVSCTLKNVGIISKDLEISPKHDKKNLSIKKEDGNSFLFSGESSENICLHKGSNLEYLPDQISNVCTKYDTNDHSFSPKKNEALQRSEKHVESLNGNLQLDLYNERILKVLSNVNLFSNLDVQFLKDVLTKIKTSTAPISNKIENTKSELNCENSILQNISITNNSKVDCVEDCTTIKSEYSINETNLCQNIFSDEKEKNVSSLYEEEIDTSLMLNLESVEECMMNSVPVVHLQSEIWEYNKSDKDNMKCMGKNKTMEENNIELSQPHNFESTKDNYDFSEVKPQTKTLCETHVGIKEPFCTLKKGLTDEDNIILDMKKDSLSSSSLTTCSPIYENLSNDTDLSTIEDNLDKMFGMEEENPINVPNIIYTDGTFNQNEFIANENYEHLNKDVQSIAIINLPKQMERKCESLVSDDNKNIPESADVTSKEVKKYSIEYSPSMELTSNNDDAISISSEEVGDGEDCYPGEENLNIQQPNNESKLTEFENEEVSNKFEINNIEIRSSKNEKIINNNDDNGNYISSRLKYNDKKNYDSSNQTGDFFVPYKKFPGFEESKIKFCRSNELGDMAYETDDDLPDLNKANFGNSLFNFKIEKCKKESTDDRNENGDTESANERCNSEKIKNITDVCGTSDFQNTESLKWKVSQKRTYNFSKDNFQIDKTEMPITNLLQKESEVNSLSRGAQNFGNKICEYEKEDKFPLKVELINDYNCDTNKITNKSQAKLKRILDCDYSDDTPKKKITVKKMNFKFKPKNRKRNMNKFSACLSPESLSKALVTSSYIIQDKVSNICPVGHSLEKCYST
ncbi:unnamed protein product, partial [Meganyctiphanes norvegica]